MKNKYKYTFIISGLLAFGVALSAFIAGWHQGSETVEGIDWAHVLKTSGAWFLVVTIAGSVTGLLLVSIYNIARRLIHLGRIN